MPERKENSPTKESTMLINFAFKLMTTKLKEI